VEKKWHDGWKSPSREAEYFRSLDENLQNARKGLLMKIFNQLKTPGGETAKTFSMAESEKEKDEERDAILVQGYAKTRKSLIARLENWEDQRTWDEFYQTYWRLIYAVAVKAGLRQDEAFDCVQETILSIAKQSKKNLYDPEQGSFKTWLMNMTRWRINDQFRKRKKDTAMVAGEWEDDRKTAVIDRVEDPNGDVLSRLWEVEWKKNVADAALARVKTQVSPKQYQIFDCYVIKGWDADRVKDQLNVSMAQVYLAKHRVGSVLKRELAKLQDEDDAE
jgi:RNA polymerase sigma factor (sigma-70 family)